MKVDFEIINHGYENSQYFQGCGVSFTSYTHVATGCGGNAKEAYEDAVEQLCQDPELDSLDLANALPSRPRGIRARDKVPAEYSGEDSDTYYYVSVRVKAPKKAVA